ncbi:MAG: bifunctional diaminohydroxyphosphoribosylaminopyrimidine deaminase/5-amino-6-(5-phosphoribosylamino)uracil reductase RibD [Bryobacteraceae bacterium]|nr:bifunctional diaminohydroxyphosphoribosylaminopyrimidine deaminase/5-amino-6-(5-phosphoribosylamino)uracil reductase RibD [Bryobacteraceae bacterium]
MHRFSIEALELARRGLGQTSPNPAVGAVVVADGEVVGRGFHVYSQKDHAEIAALREAGSKARGATLYVSLEPCSHTGRTGPCAQALIDAGVAKVVAAMEDPNPVVRGDGFRMLRAAGVEVEIDAAATTEAEKLNEPFVHFMCTGRPLVTLKAAVTLDGKIAAPDSNEGWITSPIARADVQNLRHMHDAVLSGIGTVLPDNPLYTDRSGLPRSRPLLRVVLDSQLRLPLDHKIVSSCQNDLLVVSTSAASPERRRALEALGVEVAAIDGADGRTSIAGTIALLAERKYLSLMIEAGSTVNWAVLDSGAADKIYFYYAAKILGGMQSLPVAGGVGRRRRVDAIDLERVTIHPIPPDEFAVEAYIRREDR